MRINIRKLNDRTQIVGTGVLDGPSLQTVCVAETFVKWTVGDAGPYNRLRTVHSVHTVAVAMTVSCGRGDPSPTISMVIHSVHAVMLALSLKRPSEVTALFPAGAAVGALTLYDRPAASWAKSVADILILRQGVRISLAFFLWKFKNRLIVLKP